MSFFNAVVEVIGAGGGGGCRTSGAIGHKGNAGAGGGAYSKKTVSITPGNSYTVVVGAGGQKGTATQSPTTGGDSYFDSATNVMAKGGRHSNNNSAYPDNVNTTQLLGGQASEGYGDVKYSGGAGGLLNYADFARGSGGGGAGGETGDGVQGASAGTSSPGSGGAGISPGGNGGQGGNANGSHAPAVSGYGGGGGGGCWYNSVANGADGAGGVVIIKVALGVVASAVGGVHTQAGGYDVWTFSSSGTWTPTLAASFHGSMLLALI